MSEENDNILDDSLGIVEDLKENNNNLIRQKSQIILPFIIGIVAIGYIVYSIFFAKTDDKKEVEDHDPVNIQSKTFEIPPTPIIKKVKEKVELPMSPIEKLKPKPKLIVKVNKNSKGSIINFNTPVEEPKKEKNQNQFDINLYNKTMTNVSKSNPTISTKEAPTIYKGGDYAIAGVSRQNPNLSLAKGSYIECTMVTRIVSSYAGNTKCITSEDIYSTNGVTLLIEKGSTVTGHYKGADMELGVERLFVIWDEVRTPNNVVVNLESQSTGTLGTAGVDGYVNNHWGMRFSAAILVSILDIGIESLKNKYTNNTNTNIDSAAGGKEIQDMANVELNKFINIKPTFYKNHGDVVGIYVEKDLDFSQVYRLK